MKSIVAGFIAGLFVCGSAQAAVTPTPPVSSIARATLSNGLKVVIVRNTLAPVASMSMTYGVGGDDDTMPGLAHATEHMMFRGTTDISSDQFAAIATRSGAQYNASTTNQFTQFYFTLPSAYLKVALHLEADRMTKATMGDADWANERGAIEQEVQAHASSPFSKVTGPMQAAFYGDTPYAHDALGTLESFDKMTAADIAGFYHTWYRPNNATLVIVGAVDPDQTMRDVRREFGSIPSAPVPAHPLIATSALAATTIDQSIDIPMQMVALGYRFPGTGDADYAASEVLVTALNSGRGALTSLALDGKVLAAAVIAGSYPQVGTGEFFAIGRGGSKPEDVLASLQGAIAEYQRGGIPNDLVVAAKTRLLASQDYENASIAGEQQIWSSTLEGGRETPNDIFDAIAKVTPDDVNRVFRSATASDHEVTLILRGHMEATASRVDAVPPPENVTVVAKENVALPDWTAPYFSTPLVPPSGYTVKKVTSANGMTILVRHDTTSPTIVLSGAIKTSAALYEPAGKEGVARLTQSLMALGTTTYSYKEYAAQLDAIAASVRVGTGFTMTVRAADFDRAVLLLANGELAPAFSPEMFEIVKSNLMRSLAASVTQPQTVAALAKTDAVFPDGDPRRRQATALSVSSISLDDVKNWYALAYRPDLTAVSVVGDVAPDVAIATIEKYFGGWRATGPKPAFAYPAIPISDHAASTTVPSVTNTQSQVSLQQVIGVKRSSKDAIALQIANTVLSGEGLASLLFRDVRAQHGLVYSINSSVAYSREASVFSVDFSSDPTNVEAAQASAVADINSLRTTLLPASDLERAKAVMLSNLVVGLASYSGLSTAFLSQMEEQLDGDAKDNYYPTMLAITPQDVRDAMKRWIDPTHFARVIIAPGT